MNRWILAGAVLGWLVMAVPTAAAADGCNYITGFAMLANGLPDVVGDCLEQGHYLEPGSDPRDFVQHTSNGLLVRLAFNGEPAFTDGYRSWVVDFDGRVWSRLNTEQFDWEKMRHGPAPGVPTSSSTLPC